MYWDLYYLTGLRLDFDTLFEVVCEFVPVHICTYYFAFVVLSFFSVDAFVCRKFCYLQK